jgi:hypothetical protein
MTTETRKDPRHLIRMNREEGPPVEHWPPIDYATHRKAFSSYLVSSLSVQRLTEVDKGILSRGRNAGEPNSFRQLFGLESNCNAR